MAGGFVGVDLFLASGRLLGSCALSVRCGPGNTGQDTIGFEIEIEIGLEGRCVALTVWRVQYWRELLLQLASAAGGRARGGCSSVSRSAQLHKIQLRCGVFRRDLSG